MSTAQKMKFSSNDFFSKCDQIQNVEIDSLQKFNNKDITRSSTEVALISGFVWKIYSEK